MNSGPSVAFRLCVFLAANPDECLTTRDIHHKFGCLLDSVVESLSSARRYGLVVTDLIDGRVNGPGGGYMWRAGPELLKMIGKGINDHNPL